MAKIQIKSEKLTPFGGIFSIMEKFDSMLSPVIDSTLGQRCSSIFGYQFSEIVRSLMSVYFCGGSCVEDVTSQLMRHLSYHPTLRTCSSDTILRAIKELTQENKRFFALLEANSIRVNRFRADCGSCSKEIVSEIEKHCKHFYIRANRCSSLYNDIFALRGWKTEEINGIQFELNSILVEKWEGKCYRLVIQRQRRNSGDLDLWEGEYTYRCILTNDYKSSTRDIVEFYNLRGGKERIFDDMNNGFGWSRLPKSFMAENTVFLLLTALIHNFYKTIMSRLDTKAFGLKKTSRIKAFVFRFISVPAKWIMTARQYVLNIYTENRAYAKPFKTEFG